MLWRWHCTLCLVIGGQFLVQLGDCKLLKVYLSPFIIIFLSLIYIYIWEILLTINIYMYHIYVYINSYFFLIVTGLWFGMLLRNQFGICSHFYLVLIGQSCQKCGLGNVIAGQHFFFCFVFEGLLNIYWNLEMGPTTTIW